MSDVNNVFAAAVKNFLAPIVPLMEDPTVTEILINGPAEIFVERGGARLVRVVSGLCFSFHSFPFFIILLSLLSSHCCRLYYAYF